MTHFKINTVKVQVFVWVKFLEKKLNKTVMQIVSKNDISCEFSIWQILSHMLCNMKVDQFYLLEYIFVYVIAWEN